MGNNRPADVKKSAIKSLLDAMALSRCHPLTMEDAAKLAVAREELRAVTGEQILDAIISAKSLIAGRL